MKKLIILICFLGLVSPKIYSQLLSDDFEYTVASTLTSNGWTAISGAGTNSILCTTPGGLTFPLYSGSGIGNAATIQAVTGEDVARNLSSAQTSGSVYYSCMINVSTASTGDYFANLVTTSGANNSRLFAKATTGGYLLGIQKATNSDTNYTSGVYTFGTTYLVVVKFTFVAGNLNDQMSLFVFDSSNPPPSTEPTPTVGPITFTTGTDPADLNRFLLRQGSAASDAGLIIDGVRVLNSWDDTSLPVELTSFTSTVINKDVVLNWATATELNNSGFEIERSIATGSWSTVGSVTGNGTTSAPHYYSFTDKSLVSGKYNYRLKQIDYNGNFEYFNLSNEVNIGTPVNYSLSQNYPNPFNPSTTINYEIPVDGKVNLTVFDMSGRAVSTLVNEIKTAGYYTVHFNASALSSGIYSYRISSGNFIETKKMILVK